MNILDTNIEQLKKDQFQALTEHVEKTLNEIVSLFKEKQFTTIRERFVEYSPAGDCMGCDNSFINFAWNEGERKDIEDILSMDVSLTKHEKKASDDYYF